VYFHVLCCQHCFFLSPQHLRNVLKCGMCWVMGRALNTTELVIYLIFAGLLLQDVTPENFILALTGRDDLLKGVGTGKVIKRSAY